MPIKWMLVANEFLFFIWVFRLHQEQNARGHLDLIIEVVLEKKNKRKYFLPCICNNYLLTVIFTLCHKIEYYCWIILWSARMFVVLCLHGISHRMSLWFWDICGGFFLPHARQHSATGQGYYSEAPGWPASTHWILELRIVISGWDGKSCISNDSSDSRDDKCLFLCC